MAGTVARRMSRRTPVVRMVAAFAMLFPTLRGRAQGVPATDAGPIPAATGVAIPAGEDRWDFHAQGTFVGQSVLPFHADYAGPGSLRSRGEAKETVSLDLIGGARLWHGAEFRIDGLMWQGFGLSDARGAAGFFNGEAFRKGTEVPNVTLSRVFVRQVIGLGGGEESVEGGALNFAGKRDTTRLTFTAGKMSAKDIFDANRYANDPRTQFMNWALMANGTWDYPADALGFAPGMALELDAGDWSARAGLFGVMRSANGVAVDTSFGKARAMVWELEHRHRLGTHPGAVRLLLDLNRGRMRRYDETLSNAALLADPSLQTGYHGELGCGLNLEQELTGDLGMFSRLGWNDGDTEPWMFTDIDRTATLGLSLKGTRWGRPQDTVGWAGVWNEISTGHQRFLAAGGQGITVGENRLDYGPEQILETYYRFRVHGEWNATLDYQFVNHPAYNRDRGPAHVFGLRLHWEY
jgi:high affinity Mn2+ porin